MKNEYSYWINVLFDFQGLLAGVLAITAAVMGGSAVIRAARISVAATAESDQKVDRRRASYIARLLATECQRLGEFSRQTTATIKVVVAANSEINDNSRQKTITEMHPIVHNLDAMSLLPAHLMQQVLRIHHELHKHNFDMKRAGGSYGSEAFQTHIFQQLSHLRRLTQTSQNQMTRYAELMDSLPSIVERNIPQARIVWH